MKVLIVVHHRFDLWKVPAWFTERLAQEFPQLQVVRRDSYEGVEEDLRGAEMLFTISLRPEQFALARNLRWIHAPSAAVHQLLFAALVESDVALTNSREVQDRSWPNM
jgi:phosphoglycerate dehydrogenase-like enzyme